MARRKPGRMLRDVHLKVDQKVYTVPLRLVDSTDDVTGRPKFIYVIDIEAPCAVSVRDPDVNEVLKKATEVIRDRLAIVWKDVLHVSIGAADDFDEDIDDDDREADERHGFTLKWKSKQTGRRGDEPVHRDDKRGHIYTGELETGVEEGHFRGDGTNLYAVIDDTKEGRAALAHIGRMLDVLQARLNEVLKPATIVKTLADVRARMPALLAPPPEKKVRRRVTKRRSGKKATKRPRKKTE